MYKSKVVKLYCTFSLKERKLIQKFVHSPIYNQHKDVKTLIDYLTNLKKITIQNVDRKLIHKAVFKNKNFSDSNIRHVSSYLFKIIEEFIVYQSFNNNELEKTKLLGNYYKNKGLTNLLDSNFKRYQKLSDSLKKDSEYYQLKYEILDDVFQANQANVRSKESNIEKIVESLDIYYIAEKLKQTSNILAYNTIYNKELGLSLINPILEYIQEEKLYELPLIAVHYYNYFMVKEPDNEVHFEHFMNTIERYSKEFEASELRDLYVLGINYYLKKANSGNPDYPKKVFELYKKGLLNKALLPFDTLSNITYRNIINTALYLKENKWALKFIKDYKEYLEDSVREDTYNYNLAHYYSRIGDYKSSLRILATLDFDDEIYSGRARVLQLKMHYESEEYDILDSLLDSFWIYLKRKKELGYHRDLWLKLIKYLRAIIHTKVGDDKRLLKLKGKIEEESQIMEKKWLLSKIDDLLK